MRRFLLLLSAFGLLVLTACNADEGLVIKNSSGKTVGTMQVQGTRTATFLNMNGDERGKVRGNIVRDDGGKNVGNIVERDGNVVLQDTDDNPLGSVENGTDCYGKSREKLGTVGGEVDSYIAAGACLIFFLQ